LIDLNAPPETDDSILDDVDLEGIAASQPKPKNSGNTSNIHGSNSISAISQEG